HESRVPGGAGRTIVRFPGGRLADRASPWRTAPFPQFRAAGRASAGGLLGGAPVGSGMLRILVPVIMDRVDDLSEGELRDLVEADEDDAEPGWWDEDLYDVSPP
ncbi:hypothetical protein ACFXMF_46240, partial [Embleya sp. NPDC059213]|uniref:hypothetical protein n=1 Tax=Embleya sp. NPDC059213 TaxID=3346771 RepID=UPI0036C9C1BC